MNLVQVQQNLFLDQDTGVTYTREQLEAMAAQQQQPSVGDMLAGLGQNIATRQGVNFVKDQAAKALPQVFGNAPTAAAEPVASAVGGGQLLADGTVVGAPSNVTNFLGSATPYLGAAGAALGAKGVYDAIQSGSNRQSSLSGGLSGAGAGLGLAMMGLGPVGWLAGGGALLGAALPQFGQALGLRSKNRSGEELKRLQKLREQGVFIPDSIMQGAPKSGRSMEDVIALEQAKADAGQYANMDFARTRDERYLKPEDIWGYSTFFERYGDDWLGKFNEEQRRQIAQEYLNRGLVDEARGQISLGGPTITLDDLAPKPPTEVQQIMNQPVPAMGA